MGISSGINSNIRRWQYVSESLSVKKIVYFFLMNKLLCFLFNMFLMFWTILKIYLKQEELKLLKFIQNL